MTMYICMHVLHAFSFDEGNVTTRMKKKRKEKGRAERWIWDGRGLETERAWDGLDYVSIEWIRDTIQ